MIFPQNINDLNALVESPWFMVILVWSMFWKGLALWHSSQRKQKIWFVVLFIFNTLGILEIIYLVFVAKVVVEVKMVKSKKGTRK